LAVIGGVWAFSIGWVCITAWLGDGHTLMEAIETDPGYFALFCADTPNLRGLEIKRWDGEDQVDRFVVTAEWVPSPEED
jgi:hypothetical protein